MSRIDPPTEAQWNELRADKSISTARKAAEQEYRDLTTDQLRSLRIRAKTDLYFLAKGILGYELLSPRLHGSLCRWLEKTRGEQYRLLMLPRGHYKSTVSTISESIQTALPDLVGDQPYPWSLGPDVKLLLAHETRESASRFLFEIAEAFLRKPLMLALFSDLVPNRREHRINKWELDLPCVGARDKEPTFDTIGAGAAAQGRHYNRIKLDDLMGEAARDSDTVMKTLLLWFDNVNSLLTRPRFDGWDLVGTRWSFKDTYSHAMEIYGLHLDNSMIRCFDHNEFEPGVLAAYARGAVEHDRPIFPEEFTMEFLNRIKKNPRVYAAQYANNPRESGLNEFEPGWLKFYNRSDYLLYIFEGDRTRKVNVWNLDRCILLDPSMGESKESDESGFVVTGTDVDGNIYILETVKERLKPPELIDKLFELHAKWRPRVVSIEDVVFSGVFAFWFEDKCRELSIFPNVHRYKPGSKRSKRARILGMGNYFASGQVYMAEDMHQFREEYEWFGIVDSEHLLDAFAQGPEVWQFTQSLEEAIDAERLVQNLMHQRDATTGY